MAGCSAIVLVSVVSYGLAAWPWFVVEEYRTSGLAAALGLGAGSAVVFGAVAAYRLRLAGAVGFVGGSLASAAFMYLRLQHTFAAKLDPQLPDPEYPESWAVGIPLGWTLLALGLGVLFAVWRRDPLQEG